MTISPKTKKAVVDFVERAGATFAQTFLAAVTVGSLTNLNAVKVAGVSGGYAVAKFLLVKANAFLSSEQTNVTSA